MNRLTVPMTVVIALSTSPARARAASDEPPAEVLENLDFFQNMGLLDSGLVSDKHPAPSPKPRPAPTVTPAVIGGTKEEPR